MTAFRLLPAVSPIFFLWGWLGAVPVTQSSALTIHQRLERGATIDERQLHRLSRQADFQPRGSWRQEIHWRWVPWTSQQKGLKLTSGVHTWKFDVWKNDISFWDDSFSDAMTISQKLFELKINGLFFYIEKSGFKPWKSRTDSQNKLLSAKCQKDIWYRIIWK